MTVLMAPGKFDVLVRQIESAPLSLLCSDFGVQVAPRAAFAKAMIPSWTIMHPGMLQLPNFQDETADCARYISVPTERYNLGSLANQQVLSLKIERFFYSEGK